MLRLQYLGVPHFSFSGEWAADQRRWQALPTAKRARIRLFTGHAPIETGIAEADRDIAIVTMLRDPLDRVKSLCQHVFEGKSPHLLERFPPERFDLDTFLASGHEGLSNLQAKMLINHGKAADPGRLQSLSGEKAAERALYNLRERIACFGIQERFEESLVHLQQHFGWRTPLYASSNRGSSHRRLRFEQRHLDRIAELNEVDIKVYKEARQLFLQRLENGGISHTDLRRLQTAQPVASPLIHLLIKLRGLARGARHGTAT